MRTSRILLVGENVISHLFQIGKSQKSINKIFLKAHKPLNSFLYATELKLGYDALGVVTHIN